jgi:hypothetical protein
VVEGLVILGILGVEEAAGGTKEDFTPLFPLTGSSPPSSSLAGFFLFLGGMMKELDDLRRGEKLETRPTHPVFQGTMGDLPPNPLFIYWRYQSALIRR